MSDPVTILTVNEFANLLNVNARWLYREIKRGELPCLRIGRAIRIDRDAALVALRGSSPSGQEVQHV